MNHNTGVPHDSGRSSEKLTDEERIALRRRIAQIGTFHKASKELRIGEETLRTLASGGPVQARTAARVRAVLAGEEAA